MSLSSYKSKCIEKYKIANPDKDIPSNMGCKWSDIEERALLDNIQNNLDIEEIAKKHSRTSGAISARLEVIAMRMYEENRYDIEYIEKLTRLNEQTIQEAINKKRAKNDKYETKNYDVSHTEVTKVMTLKRDLQICFDEIKDIKANVRALMETDSRSRKDDIEDLKKQIQNMLDINNIKSDIIELKKATLGFRDTLANAAVAM
jgi:uncharacterized protein YgiM (DUF1202 family)